MADPNLIKVCLTNKGEDTETPWAADLGPAGADGSRRVKLVNVPFMHAKPTWGDTIVVRPVRGEGFPTWDRDGVPWKQIASKIVEDGGRWAMILDYAPRIAADEAFKELSRACDEAKIVCEVAWGPRERDPGRVYLAVQKELTAEQVMGILGGASLPVELIQIHPEPKKRTRAQTVTGIGDAAGRPPGPRAKTEPPVVATSSAMKKPARAKTEPPVAAKKTETTAAAKPAAKPAAKTAAPTKAPPAKVAAKPAAKPVAKAPAKVAAKPVAKAAAKPAAKLAAKPAAKAPAKKSAPPPPKKTAKKR